MSLILFILFILFCLSIAMLLVFNVYELHVLEELKENKKEQNKPKQFKREHAFVSKTNFGSIINGRTNVYAKYKNKDGLYEPVRTKNGVELKKREV